MADGLCTCLIAVSEDNSEEGFFAFFCSVIVALSAAADAVDSEGCDECVTTLDFALSGGSIGACCASVLLGGTDATRGAG
eukprot:COSAG01_NODE_4010_length_5437_cov_5.981828_3_plen_80_part_00